MFVLLNLLEILFVEVRSHFAPYLDALHASQEALLLQVKPVGLVELGADEEVDVRDLVILSDQGRGQPQLAVGFTLVQNFLEHVRREYLDLIKEQEAPFAILNDVEDGLRLIRTVALERHHCVG